MYELKMISYVGLSVVLALLLVSMFTGFMVKDLGAEEIRPSNQTIEQKGESHWDTCSCGEDCVCPKDRECEYEVAGIMAGVTVAQGQLA